MKSKVLICAAAAALCVGSAFAQSSGDGFTAGSILVRARALHFDSANKDSTGLGLSVNNKWVTPAEVDVSYFLTKNLAGELILAIPQKFHVYSDTLGQSIGTVRALPPTLTAQYHFDEMSGFKPYVGAGINYTRFSAVHLAGGAANIKKNSFGPALQVGMDLAVAKNIYVNLDVKKVWMRTRVSLSGAEIGTLRLDPWLIGVGVGYRF